MRELLQLYLEYLKTAAAVMAWATVTLAAYALVRTSGVAETIAAAVLSGIVSLVVALVLIEYFSPSRVVRRKLVAVLEAALKLLLKSDSGSGQKQRA